jgi:hypothetical protein
MRIRRRLLVGGILALVTFAGLASGASGGQPKQPDLQLAMFTNAGCGTFADSLPPIVTESGVAPGETVSDLTLCLRNVGGDGRALALRATELSDVDPTCTGDEATFDASCGGGDLGELSASLIQHVGIDLCRRSPPIVLLWDRSLASLSTSALVVAARLQKGKLLCVRVALRYQPDAAAAAASQSDRATWRYSFTLGADGEN